MKTIKRHISTTSYSLTYILIGVVIFLTPTPIALAQSLPATDRDTDDDGLIEISTLAQLNAIRHDSDGDGTSSESAYNSVLGSSLTNSGCPSTCTGYELTADLDFDTNGDDSFESSDDYYNSGSGWEPIGDGTNTFNATFHGNGHTISNLTVDRDTSHWGGLFGELGADAIVRDLGLIDASVSAMGANRNNPGEHGVGGLAGVNRGLIYHTYINGVVVGEGAQRHTGGLVGRNMGRVLASYSQALVTGDYDVGGLVGYNDGSVLWTYATGRVRSSGFDVGGLVGDQSSAAEIAYSYSTADVNAAFGNANAGGLISGSDDGTITQSYFDSDRSNRPSSDSYSKTSSELQSPSSASGIFSDWGKSTTRIYEGRMVPSHNAQNTNKLGYAKDSFGSLSPTAIGSATIEEIYVIRYGAKSVFIKLTENDSKIDSADLLSGANITFSTSSQTLTSPIKNIITGASEDQIKSNIRQDTIAILFLDNTNVTLRFDRTLGGSKHTVDASNLWDFGTSDDLPLLSVDFDGDDTASTAEFGEQVDEIKPVITINGDDPVVLIEGSAFTDDGATVRDPGNPSYAGTVSTTISGPDGQTAFDSAVVGDWNFIYTAPSDSAGNTPIPLTRRVVVITRPTAETSIFHAKYKPGNWIVKADRFHGHRLPDKNALTYSDGNAHNTFTYNSVTYTLHGLSYGGEQSRFNFILREGSNNVDEQTALADVSLIFIDENDDLWIQAIKDYVNESSNLKSESEYCCSPFTSTVPWSRWQGTDTTIDVYLIDISSIEVPPSDTSDEVKPIITVKGDTSVSIVSGGTYRDLGADVIDPGNPTYTGVVTTTIRGPGGQTSFNNNIVGDWTFTYSAPADGSGNVPDSVTRTVTVVAAPISIDDAIFSANFAPRTVIHAGDHVYGHKLPSKNALTDDDGNAYNTFTLGGVEYTVDEFSQNAANEIYFRIKEGSNHVDERVVFADYSLVIVDQNDAIFAKEITDFFGNIRGAVRLSLSHSSTPPPDPFENPNTWNAIRKFSIIETPSLDDALSLDFDNSGAFVASQDALSLYLVTQLSATANTLSSYVHDGSSRTAGKTITLINSLTKDTSLDFDNSGAFVASQDALSLFTL